MVFMYTEINFVVLVQVQVQVQKRLFKTKRIYNHIKCILCCGFRRPSMTKIVADRGPP